MIGDARVSKDGLEKARGATISAKSMGNDRANATLITGAIVTGKKPSGSNGGMLNGSVAGSILNAKASTVSATLGGVIVISTQAVVGPKSGERGVTRSFGKRDYGYRMTNASVCTEPLTSGAPA